MSLLYNTSLCQTLGCRSVRPWSTLSLSHPVLFVIHTLKVSEHDSLWPPPAAHSDERPRPQKSFRAQRCLNALTPGYLEGTVVRGHPIVWLLRCARMMQSNTWWCTVRSLGYCFSRRIHVLHPYMKASIASASTIRVLRESASFGWS